MAETATHSGTTIADRLQQALVTAIVKGDMAPGSKINEPGLARAFDVSRGPLREAIRRLEGMHLVESIPHAGARVVRLSVGQLRDVYEIREALEGMAVRLAARHMPDADLQELERLLDLHEGNIAESQGREYWRHEGDFGFHYRLIRGSGNRRLIQLLCEELYHVLRMYRYRASRAPQRPPKALAEHRAILDALRQRDEEFAEMLMRRHISGARESIRQQICLEPDDST